MESEIKISRIFSILKEVALSNPKVSGARVSAAIVQKSKIISIGVNSTKSSPFQAKYAALRDLSIFLHAEIAAIKNATRYLEVEEFSKTSLYICRVKTDVLTNNLIFGMSKPCSGCTRAILEFNIKNVCYTTDDGKWSVL
jgi:deoxycytidylate deaminase